MQCCLEGAQTLVDGHELDDVGPGLDQVLHGIAHLAERGAHLLEDTEGDGAGCDRRDEDEEGQHQVCLQIGVTHHVEVEIVEVEAEVVVPHGAEQFHQRARRSTARIVLAIDQFLAIGGLDALVAELEPRQPDADNGKQARPEQRPDQRDDDQRVGRRSENRDRGNLGRQHGEDRQEGDERHDGTDQAGAQILEGTGKAHGVFLHALCGTLDAPQGAPAFHVVVVHRRAPAKHVVAGEEGVEHGDHDVEQQHRGDLAEADIEVGGRHRSLGRGVQRLLDQVEVGAIPVIDGDAHLDHEIQHEDDERRSEYGPVEIGVGIENAPYCREDRHGAAEVEIEPDERRRHEPRHADDGRRIGGRIGKADQAARIPRQEEPHEHGQQCPQHGGREEQAGRRKEGDEHHWPFTAGFRAVRLPGR